MEFIYIPLIVLVGLALIAALESTMVVNKSFVIGGVTYTESQTVSANRSNNGSWTLPTDQPATYPLPQPAILSIRGSGNGATFVMENVNHQIVTTLLVDVYWTDPVTLEPFVQVNCTVSSVTGTTVVLSGGSVTGVSSVFPVIATSVTISPSTQFPYYVDGSNMVGLIANCVATNGQAASAAQCAIQFNATGTQDGFVLFLQPGQIYDWYETAVVNPLGTLQIVNVRLSHSSQSVAQTIQVSSLLGAPESL